jgi:hypothetical protein
MLSMSDLLTNTATFSFVVSLNLRIRIDSRPGFVGGKSSNGVNRL